MFQFFSFFCVAHPPACPALGRQDDKLMFDPLSFNDFPAIMASPTKEVPRGHFQWRTWRITTGKSGDKKLIKQNMKNSNIDE